MKMINLRDSATIGGIKVISLEGSGGGSTIVPVTEWSSVPSNENVPSEKLTYDSIYPTIVTSQPSGGMLPNIPYDLGELSGNVTITFAPPIDNNVINHYFFIFETGATAPTITWPAAVVAWYGGTAPTIDVNKHYEVSVLDGIGVIMEV